MPSSHENPALRRMFALLVSAVLACGTCPLTAFASTDNLATAAPTSQNAAGRLLSVQSSSVKSAKKTTKKSAAFTIKKYGKTRKYSYATAKWAYGKPAIKGSSTTVQKINKSLNKRYKAYRKNLGSFLGVGESETRAMLHGVKFLGVGGVSPSDLEGGL